MFGGIYRGTRVLVTGHTGFKGSWLTRWLLELGADVAGLALAPETDPALFDLLGLEGRIRHHLLDIRDAEGVEGLVAAFRPEVVFHLAAQPLVRLSYKEPRPTWDVNVLGTINLLEALRKVGSARVCVAVTTDKCYENHEQLWGYREIDPLGGHDPYSSSKAAAELAVASWRRSFFQGPEALRLASARAGNVIGGGDWAADRIVVDFVREIASGRPLILRNPQATRPWQHVLEPLSGYLHLAARLWEAGDQALAGAWNFGPSDASMVSVLELAQRLVGAWGTGMVQERSDPGQPHEAGLLKLDCSKAQALLGWRGLWDVETTARATVAWYRGHLEGQSPEALTLRQIHDYEAAAAHAGLSWTR
ncbi:MAG: CDP-glucose 4,6-dehydratase [Holophagaceae bacterium]